MPTEVAEAATPVQLSDAVYSSSSERSSQQEVDPQEPSPGVGLDFPEHEPPLTPEPSPPEHDEEAPRLLPVESSGLREPPLTPELPSPPEHDEEAPRLLPVESSGLRVEGDVPWAEPPSLPAEADEAALSQRLSTGSPTVDSDGTSDARRSRVSSSDSRAADSDGEVRRSRASSTALERVRRAKLTRARASQGHRPSVSPHPPEPPSDRRSSDDVTAAGRFMTSSSSSGLKVDSGTSDSDSDGPQEPPTPQPRRPPLPSAESSDLWSISTKSDRPPSPGAPSRHEFVLVMPTPSDDEAPSDDAVKEAPWREGQSGSALGGKGGWGGTDEAEASLEARSAYSRARKRVDEGCSRTSRRVWVALGASIVLAVALGTGLGLGLGQRTPPAGEVGRNVAPAPPAPPDALTSETRLIATLDLSGNNSALVGGLTRSDLILAVDTNVWEAGTPKITSIEVSQSFDVVAERPSDTAGVGAAAEPWTGDWQTLLCSASAFPASDYGDCTATASPSGQRRLSETSRFIGTVVAELIAADRPVARLPDFVGVEVASVALTSVKVVTSTIAAPSNRENLEEEAANILSAQENAVASALASIVEVSEGDPLDLVATQGPSAAVAAAIAAAVAAAVAAAFPSASVAATAVATAVASALASAALAAAALTSAPEPTSLAAAALAAAALAATPESTALAASTLAAATITAAIAATTQSAATEPAATLTATALAAATITAAIAATTQSAATEPAATLTATALAAATITAAIAATTQSAATEPARATVTSPALAAAAESTTPLTATSIASAAFTTAALTAAAVAAALATAALAAAPVAAAPVAAALASAAFTTSTIASTAQTSSA
ncbi:hypothetical protein EMIHUDRAFT_113066 [Emiliania huxleyi CCMP1516]|uniref:Uncharacterized protein n=2 Tax=Emiliania huxleyi TaxID=2903 RepID=A0A0D3K4W4_EMIH1|nr:hypothetical protein EMIHUDRAFT_113066 [Emiliania huxleyi CCMP1516]EOD30799.1 hypothetical protein EMIHUDRAFT_113066 [Emiliania huxleyi CCMP1516]|eukprot:XP_005783228.1 hypothetical protein EMIHUDRAFT_113066 [Emiliania huxleyi CCMP1516]